MKTITFALSLALASTLAVAKGGYEAVMIDAATDQEIAGSEAKAKNGRFKVEIPFVLPGDYRVCLPLGVAALDLGSAVTDDGELKHEGDLPAGDYPIRFSVHADRGDCASLAAFYSEAIVDDEEPEDELEDDD